MPVAVSTLSPRLAALELGRSDSADLCQMISREALAAIGGERALVWLYRPSLGRLFAEQAGTGVRAVDVDDAAIVELFGGVAVWPPAVTGVRRVIVEASFGVAQTQLPRTLVVPLRASAGPVGVLVVESPMCTDADAIEPLAKQAAAVLVNHEALSRVRRHENQLEALYQTAGEVSAKLELQTVLEAILERARTLVGAPISYIMLSDPDRGEITMRAAAGVSTPGFRDIRLRMGAGLGGATAQTERAFYTSDYLNDARFSHSPPVDAQVRAEQIKSIVGVPMRASASLIGVLYVADRDVRVFTEADVDILASLARHAALAIDNAALYERATAALEEIRQVNQVVEQQNRRLRRADDVHRRLSEAVLAGAELAEVVELIARLVDAHVVVLDDSHRVLAAAGRPTDEFGSELAERGLVATTLTDRRIRDALCSVEASGSTGLTPNPPHRAHGRLIVPVVARGDLLGSIWAEVDPSEPDARQTMEEASRVVALELLKERSVAEVERREARELLDELLSERPPTQDVLLRRAKQLRIDLGREHRLLATQPTDGSVRRGDARRLRHDLSVRLSDDASVAFVGEYAGRLVALVEGPADRRVDARLGELLDRHDVKAIVSDPCLTPADYRAAFLAADGVLGLLGDQLRGPLLSLGEVHVLALLFGGAPKADLREFVRRKLGPLEEAGGPDLVGTLEAYLESGSNAARAAAALHIHVNTLYYRLERVRAVLGDALDQPHGALDVRIALVARRLLEPVAL